MADGQVVFEIKADGKRAISDVKEVTKSIEQEAKKWDDAAGSATGSIESSFGGMAKKIVGVLSAAKVASTLLSWGKAAVEAASDLQEVQNVVDTTFGDSATQIETWAKNAGQQFGLTELQAKKFTSTLGAMMKSAGMAGPEIVSMSTDLAGLAADMASFYNLDFETAFQKIRSGISGETEPLKQLGVNMSVANLEAFALTKGITKAFEQMSQGEQTMLRYQYLMQATADAQGDFARTADGYANSTRRIEAALDTIKSKAGEVLLPLIGDLTTGFAGFLEELTASPERTVIDDFNEIEIDTAAKLAQIEKVSSEASLLVTSLEEINTKQITGGGLTSFVGILSNDINNLDGALTTAKNGDFTGTISAIASALELETGTDAGQWETLLTAISDNLGDVTSATSADASTASFLSAAADAANKLGGNYPALWKQLLEALGEDQAVAALQALQSYASGAGTLGTLAIGANKLNAEAKERWGGFISAFSGMDEFSEALGAAKSGDFAGTISGLATALSNTTGFSESKWSTLLTEISGNLPAANTAASGETVSDFLSAAADAANKLGGEYPAMWKALVDTLGSDKATAMLQSLAGGEGKGDYLSQIAQSANKLHADSASHWEATLTAIQKVTGSTFGNSAQTASERIRGIAEALSGEGMNEQKAAAFQELISTLAADAESLTGLSGTDAEGTREFLESLATAANALDPDNADGWDTLLTALATGLSGGVGTDAGNTFYDTMSSYFLALGTDSQAAVAGLTALGYSTDDIEDAQARWLARCKELVRTIPGLASIVNTETGEIEGGTEAVNAYIKAWEEGQKKLIAMRALEQKEQALANKKVELVSYELDMSKADLALRKFEEEHPEFAGKRNDKTYLAYSASAKRSGYTALVEAAEAATKAYNEQTEAVKQAEEEIKLYREAVEEMPGEIEQVTEATADWAQETQDAGRTALQAAKDAITALADYYQGVKDSTRSAVDSTVKGFQRITSAEEKMANNKQLETLEQQLKDLGGRTEQNAKEWDELNSKINKLKGETIVTPNDMLEGLESQLAFLKEYQKNLALAQEMGLSDELLAFLSDGSIESAEYLAVLVSNGGMAGQIDQLYQQIEEQKKGLTDSLTQQKIKVDETYDAMAAKAKEAIEAMNLQGEAADAMGQTVMGLAQGISDHVPELQTAVDAIEEQLNRLNGWGINIDLGSFGTFNVSLGKETDVEQHETGLDRVPYDGYLASLHEGEGILTAEENRVWQRFKNGSYSGMDYDTLGGVMRDNVHAGGNVYLDGRTVGQVISDRQGQSYRSLQRSGWQQ